MKLSQNDRSLLFSSTEIPDTFFTEYLPEASGDFIKVYFYMLFLSKYNKEIKINDLSKTLSLDFKIVQDALKYWEDQQVLTKTPTGYLLANIQEIELFKLYNPKVTLSPEDMEKNSQSQSRDKAIEIINRDCFGGVMSPSWYNDISFWFTKYGFDEQVMLALFNYCHDKRALHRNYIQTVADSWSKNNINTFNDLDMYFEKQEKRNIIKSDIAKKLKLSRNLTEYDEEYIVKWTENYGYGMEIIEIALKKAAEKNSIRFEYIDSLLTDWKNHDLRTVQDVHTHMQTKKESGKKSKQSKNSNLNYTQRTFENLESLYYN